MRRLQERAPLFKGEITAFLALVFILMMSLVGALVESASIQMTRNRKRTDMELALESVFAEYDKEMLEEYELFVRKGCEKETIEKRLAYYGIVNMSHFIQRQERLTDAFGTPFREQAIRYAKNWLGIKDNSDEVSSDFTASDEILQEEESVQTELKDLLEQEEAGLPEEDNPLDTVQKLKDTNLIQLVCEEPEELSDQSLTLEELPSERDLQAGNWGNQEPEGGTDRVFFAAYLKEHFGNITAAKEGHALLYEQEYLLSGYSSDQENLEKICEKILKVRMAANYVYLLTDVNKQAEAEALALSLCSLLTVPGIAIVVKHALLLAWAYGESIVDVRALLKGKKVPAVKTAENWQLQLTGLMKLGTEEEDVGEQDAAGGLDYQSYLTGLLVLENKDVLSMRALDLIESNLQIRTDECMTKIEIRSEAVLRRGIQENFFTKFGYQ